MQPSIHITNNIHFNEVYFHKFNLTQEPDFMYDGMIKEINSNLSNYRREAQCALFNNEEQLSAELQKKIIFLEKEQSKVTFTFNVFMMKSFILCETSKISDFVFRKNITLQLNRGIDQVKDIHKKCVEIILQPSFQFLHGCLSDKKSILGQMDIPKEVITIIVKTNCLHLNLDFLNFDKFNSFYFYQSSVIDVTKSDVIENIFGNITKSCSIQ
jgi:hypothetical protein